MGELFNEIKSRSARKGNKSRIQEIAEQLSDSDKKDFFKALDDHGIPASNISKALEARGFKLAPNVISRYRRGELVTEIK